MHMHAGRAGSSPPNPFLAVYYYLLGLFALDPTHATQPPSSAYFPGVSPPFAFASRRALNCRFYYSASVVRDPPPKAGSTEPLRHLVFRQETKFKASL